MTRGQIDTGGQLLRDVTEWARTHARRLVRGHVAQAVPSVFLELEETTEPSSELQALLDSIDPYLLVVDPYVLKAEDVDARLESLVARGTDADRLDVVEGYRQFVGQHASLGVYAFNKDGPAVFAYRYFAPWSDDALGDDSNDGIDPPPDPETEARLQEAREDREKWTSTARTEAARRIARDPRFPKAKKEADRVFLARDVLGSDLPKDEYTVKEIGREAASIYKLEIASRGSQ